MNRAARRKYMKKIKSFNTYRCTECGNEFVIFKLKDGSGDFEVTKKSEEMCMGCYNRYLELKKMLAD